MAGIVLHYFPAYGRAEATRMMLKSKGVEFEERLYTFEEWGAAKSSFEFHQMPMLEIDGFKLVTSQAIERYVAHKYGLYPEDPYQAYLVDSVVDLKADQVVKIMTLKYVTKDDEAFTKWASTGFIDNLKLIEARLVANGGGDGFFVGSHATWADFSLFQFLHRAFSHPETVAMLPPHIDAAVPKLKAFVDRFLANDANLSAYIAARPHYAR
jgi:glutathione S-transferase